MMPGPFFLACLSMLCVLVLTAPVVAQDCSAVLGNVYDRTRTNFTSAKWSNFTRFFCDQEFSSRQQAVNMSGSAGIPIDGLPVEFKGTNAFSDWSGYQRSVCENIQSEFSENTELSVTIESINSRVIQAWEACIARTGLHLWLESTLEDPSAFFVKVKYVPPGAPYTTRLTSPLTVQPPGAMRCSGDIALLSWAPSSPPLEVDLAGKILNCRRDSRQGLAFSIGTEHGTGDATLKPFIPPPPPRWSVDVARSLSQCNVQDAVPPGGLSRGAASWSATGSAITGMTINQAGQVTQRVLICTFPITTGKELSRFVLEYGGARVDRFVNTVGGAQAAWGGGSGAVTVFNVAVFEAPPPTNYTVWGWTGFRDQALFDRRLVSAFGVYQGDDTTSGRFPIVLNQPRRDITVGLLIHDGWGGTTLAASINRLVIREDVVQ
jgi:hypothetical protein